MTHTTYQALKDRENQYVMPTYNRFPIALDHGKGSTLWDVEGKKYIDLTSGIGVNCLGYDHEKLIEAMTAQAHKLMHVSNLFTTAPMIDVAETLCKATGMSKVFFANSGAEANEGAIKLARKYSFDKYGKGRAKIITLVNSFHGRTITTLQATGQDVFHNYFFPFTEGFDYAQAGDLEDLKSKIDDSTCAVMMELIQGEGGVLPQDPAYVQAVEKLCREKDLLLLIDEVQTGIGRTGALFCFQNYGIHPDVVSMAKALGGGVPVGGVMAAKTCDTVLGPGTHATTFGATPLVCACAKVVLEEVNQPAFLQAVREKGDYIQEKIRSWQSPKIKAVRGQGLMIGVIVEEGKHSAYAKEIIEKGALVLTAGKDAIRLLPPLNISYEEIDEALAAMQAVLA